MESFPIRNAVPADREAVESLFRRSSLSNDGDRGNLLAHPDVLEFPVEALGEGRTRVAIDSDGEIVGFATVAYVDGAVELEDLFVAPDHMRRGIGRQLVLDVVGRARQGGAPRVEVTANHHALAFYEDVGFVFDHDVETRFGVAPRMVLRVTR